jgi:hypothetical protein
MADPANPGPVARESTRLLGAAVTGAQTTLDPVQMKAWTPNSRYGGHAFGFMPSPDNRDTQFAEFLAARDRLLPQIERYSPYALVTADDPPPRRPNILFVIVDDQSPLELRAYDPASPLATPVIDRLAAEGMVLDAAYHMGSFSARGSRRCR